MQIEIIPMEHQVFANCYMLTDDESRECAIVDPGWCYQSTVDAIEKARSKGANIKYILFTHGHFDHIMGALDVKNLTGAKTVIHSADAKCLNDPDESLASENMPMPQKCVDADIVISDGDELFLGNEKIKVMHTPGHTEGGVCYIIENPKIILSGDTLFCSTVGRTDIRGGNEEKLKNSLRRLISLDGDYAVYPGHSRATTLENERHRNRYIRRMENK